MQEHRGQQAIDLALADDKLGNERAPQQEFEFKLLRQESRQEDKRVGGHQHIGQPRLIFERARWRLAAAHDDRLRLPAGLALPAQWMILFFLAFHRCILVCGLFAL